MTEHDLLQLLKQKTAELGQSNVARALSYSSAAISQILSGTYRGDSTNILQKVREMYGGISVQCPILDQITLELCANQRRKDFAATNPQRVKLYQSCKKCQLWQKG